MKTLVPSLLVFIIFNSHNLACQFVIDSNPGLDPEIHNGIIYHFSALNIKGHQFLYQEDFIPGSITIGNSSWTGLFLNYDIYNQEILLKSFQNSREVVLSIPKEIVREFTLRDRHFLILNEEGWFFTIFEEIGCKDLKFLKKWSKDKKVSSRNEVTDYEFSRAIYKMYLVYCSETINIPGRKSFLKTLPDQKREPVAKYMRQQKIHLRRATNGELLNILDYIESVNTVKWLDHNVRDQGAQKF